MNNLKSINLTENDFDMMVKGLDALPNKDAAGEMMGDLLFGMLSKGADDIGTAKLEIDKQKAKAKRDRDMLTEDVRVLQGKLILLKRYLLENDLMDKVTEMLH